MAKNAIVHKVTTTEEIKLSGIVSEDGLTMDLDGEIKHLADFYKKFAGKHIDVSMKEKTEEEIADTSDLSNE
ncbi:hypothetical protein [Konateibacter massiliensis]|uniref:hypothetical protein n=1 Tax=Konateibacter massiliensis TaxID=2002841 RepID=UPI000C150CEF|nr:hypothetical protein [Konateibacter massiliensis]